MCWNECKPSDSPVLTIHRQRRGPLSTSANERERVRERVRVPRVTIAPKAADARETVRRLFLQRNRLGVIKLATLLLLPKST